MPLPKPRTGDNPETHSQWMSRCMSNDTMKEDFPDNEQRVAVCMNIWREEHKDMSQSLLEAIRARSEKKTEFGYGILTADRWVQNMRDAAGLDLCYQYASQGQTSFDDVLRKASKTLTYSNPDMVVEEDITKNLPDGIVLPKDTLMVFKHTLTTPKIDRDGDILRTEGAAVDPRMLLLWQHVHTLPIGKMLAITQHTKDKLQLISCIVDINDLSHDAAVMIDNDMGRFSHGFRALDWSPLVDDKGEEIGGFEVKSFEVMEESLVSVPSNTDAQSEEVLLSLVEGGKLTSDLMKEIGKSIRDHRPLQVAGVEIPKEEKNEDITGSGSGETEPAGEPETAGSGTPKEADADEVKEPQQTIDTEVIMVPISSEVIGAYEGTITCASTNYSEYYESPEEKAGRALSAKNLTVLRECLEDVDELLNKGFEMERGGIAICERVKRKLTEVIDSASSEQPEEEREFTVLQAMSLVVSEADRKQRDRVEYILRGIREAEDKQDRAKKFKRLRRGK